MKHFATFFFAVVATILIYRVITLPERRAAMQRDRVLLGHIGTLTDLNRSNVANVDRMIRLWAELSLRLNEVERLARPEPSWMESGFVTNLHGFSHSTNVINATNVIIDEISGWKRQP